MATVLITGANKGIGAGFVAKYLARDDTTVIATVRNPDAADAKALKTLPKGAGSQLFIVKLESTSDTDATEAIASIAKHGISHLDVVIANAGIFPSSAFQEVRQLKPQDLLLHFDVNTVGPVRLYQAVLPLLSKAKEPKFAAISSAVSTISGAEHVPYTINSYGASKAALNFLIRRIHIENKDVIAIAFHPGAVKTDEGNKAAQVFGFPEAFTTVDDAVNGVVGKIDIATRDSSSGKFLAFDDTPLAW